MFVVFTRIVELLCYPPCGPLVLVAIGALVGRRWRRAGRWAVVSGWVALYLFATPAMARALMWWVEETEALELSEIASDAPTAIVVLAGPDRTYDAPERGRDTVGPHELSRLSYAAWLHRQTSLPLMVVGGDIYGRGVPEADLMAAALRDDFGVEVQWADGRSRRTSDNARYAREVLGAVGIDRVVLVTHAWHMARASRMFRDAGFEVLEAPTAFATASPGTTGLGAIVPQASALQSVQWSLHELVGRAYYALLGG